MSSTSVNQSAAVLPYQQTNQWLQDLTRKAGAGKALWPPKPSVNNAQEVVHAFLSYQKMTTGVLEHFMDSYLQFEKAGRMFHTEHALTQAILSDSASRAVPMPDRNMVAFVSTSARAVSSDALFLRMTLDALDADAYGNEFTPNTTASVQLAHTANQSAGLSARVGMGVSFFSMFKASTSATAEQRHDNQVIKQAQTVGKTVADAGDRQALSCLSAIYALEQSGILPERQMMKTLVRLSDITQPVVAGHADGYAAIRDICCTPARSIDPINDALRTENMIGAFLMRFAKDNRKETAETDTEAREFWSSVFASATGNSTSVSGWMDRYADHNDRPESTMAVSLLRMVDILQKSRKEAMAALQPVWMVKDEHISDGSALISVAVSPAFGVDAALVVTQFEGKLTPRKVSIQTLANLFPEFHPVLQPGMMGDMMVRSDAWESAILVANQISKKLEDVSDAGMMTVTATDVNGNACLVTQPDDLPDGEMDSSSPWN